MFDTKVHRGKAFDAEQKIGQFKKILLSTKRFEKNSNKRVRPNHLIKTPAQNMNQTISTKYQLAPETIEKQILDPKDGKYFQEIYDFMKIKKIENSQMRNNKYNKKIDRRKRTLRSPLNLNKKV